MRRRGKQSNKKEKGGGNGSTSTGKQGKAELNRNAAQGTDNDGLDSTPAIHGNWLFLLPPVYWKRSFLPLPFLLSPSSLAT